MFLICVAGEEEEEVVVDRRKMPGIGGVLRSYAAVKEAGLLMPVEFSSLSEYLHLLKAAAQALNPIGENQNKAHRFLTQKMQKSLKMCRKESIRN